MTFRSQVKCALFLGVSALAYTSISGSATAQEAERRYETVMVTTQKTAESIQDVPIAVSAFDEDTLERLQLAGGPDLVRSIPNVSFTKSNFTGSNFRIRGIGADLVATSGDTGVGIHQNDVPLTANRLFESEFFDVERVEVLRGPQGTLYGRNATGGVVNVITAKPVLEEYQGQLQVTLGSDNALRAEGMVNIPIGETAALRIAGAYLTRDGFATNTVTGNDIDGRDLGSIRATLAWEPTDDLRGYFMVEHFQEDDNRLRSGKQLCNKDPFETSFFGIPIEQEDQIYTSTGCQEAPLSDSFDRLNTAASLGGGLAILAGLLDGDAATDPLNPNMREIESFSDPSYQADQTLYTLQLEYDLTDDLTLTYLGSHNTSSVLSEEDHNKLLPTSAYNTTAGFGLVNLIGDAATADFIYQSLFPGGVVTDPQLGVDNQLRSYDLSGADTEQTSHELRIQSDYDGRFNFNLGAIWVDYESGVAENPNESYYVFSNSLTAVTQINNALGGAIFGGPTPVDTSGDGAGPIIGNIDATGRNYYRSISPYELSSYALFGESYIDLTDDLQLTVGLRYTNDDKSQENIPIYFFVPSTTRSDIFEPFPTAEAPNGIYNVQFEEVTGRIGLDWSPELDFTDDTLIYGFYSRGYKGGGINPPQPSATINAFPQTFDPEFINSYEIGTKNTLMQGALQLNATGFFYDYEGYQITQIINQTSANFNIDANIQGFELETIWNATNNLIFNANLGLLNTEIQDSSAIDVLNRTNGDPNYVVIKNASNYSNCVVSAAGYATILGAIQAGVLNPGDTGGLCLGAFMGLEGAFGLPDGAFTPSSGFETDLDGNSIPGSPDTTLSLGAEYIVDDVFNGWDMSLRGDYYYQSESFTRVWNTPHDRLDSWDNLNLSVRFTNEENNMYVEIFGKNVMDEEVITGAYLTDDSDGLFTNVFLNEPATYGITVSRTW
ncbi:TonB-dependent receptor [Ponticaulis sp.]|uniref:TonB-dependent receptor n=1 Tax=Ponticaulis sp. TaxID=2020902 RepID=UPI000B6798FF|nr:TonB-dependent receptor [Ponticaulis sp.]OUX99929.1 MAG: TonB-dependent receptor [Hyphomonadaceae bacterium TMED5]